MINLNLNLNLSGENLMDDEMMARLDQVMGKVAKLQQLGEAPVPTTTTTPEPLPAIAEPVLTMSSLEVADLTGKLHKSVIRDTEKMLIALDIDADQYVSTYVTKQNKTAKCYDLPKNLTITLVLGYNVKMRHAITNRWLELEGVIAEPDNDDEVGVVVYKEPKVTTFGEMACITGSTPKARKPKPVATEVRDDAQDKRTASIKQWISLDLAALPESVQLEALEALKPVTNKPSVNARLMDHYIKLNAQSVNT